MAEFQEVIRQKERMCKSFTLCEDGCPFNENKLCRDYPLTKHPQKAEEIIMKWAKENPIKTNADKFKEIFGFEPYIRTCMLAATVECDECEYKSAHPTCSKIWWNDEYKEPKVVE